MVWKKTLGVVVVTQKSTQKLLKIPLKSHSKTTHNPNTLQNETNNNAMQFSNPKQINSLLLIVHILHNCLLLQF